MKRITHGFVALLLGLAPAALASPNQPQSWNEQNAWNEENQQNEQTPQNQQQQNQQQQPEQQQQPQQQQQQPEQQQWGGPQGQPQGNWQEPPQPQQPQQAPQQQQQEPRQPYQDPSQNQPLPPPNQQMPPKPAWQQPVPNAGWQNQNQAWNQYQGYQQPMQHQMSTRPHLGIFVEGLTPELRSYFGAPNDRGLLVARVERHTAASRAGLQVGDVLMAIEGQPVNSANDVIGTLSRLSPTALIHLDIMRNGRQITLMTQLRPRPQLFRGQHT
jgi:hypothetical protein